MASNVTTRTPMHTTTTMHMVTTTTVMATMPSRMSRLLW